MAWGFARHVGGGKIEARSAGVEPSRLNPYAVRAMQEKSIDISGQRSKAFDWELARQMDLVVTVCGHANESCPVLPPEVKRLHWPLEESAAAPGTDAEIMATFRHIRDQVESRALDLLARCANAIDRSPFRSCRRVPATADLIVRKRG